MKVLVGCLYHETNTFNPFLTRKEDFVLVEGEAILDRFGSTKAFSENDVELVPTIYATALSSGVVEKEAYRFFVDKMIETLEKNKDIDGIWMHLHGSMVVEDIGSGELALLKEIRQVIGFEIPISLTLDIHGNLPVDLCEYVNIVRSYRTVPHEDQLQVEYNSANSLIEAIKNNSLIKPYFKRLPMIIPGEKALGKEEPLKSIFEKINELENRQGISQANFFICHAWSDTENTASSILVVPENEEYNGLAENITNELAEFVFNRRSEFKFNVEALEPQATIKQAVLAKQKPVFISDSGDNTTAGAIGMNTEMLQVILDANLQEKKILIAAIYDEDAFEKMKEKIEGENIKLNVGKNIDDYSKPVLLKGRLKSKGELLGYLNATEDKVGDVCTIELEDKNVDVVIANKANSFITLGHFERGGVNIDEYDIIVVKQGYLFPELSEYSKSSILALTHGTTYQIIEDIDYKYIQKPLFPMENVKFEV